MDLIDRAAAIDAFLTELTKRERNNLLHTWSTVEVKYFVADMLGKLPSAQPELIRCKDCKWYEGDIMANPWGVCCHDGWVGGNIGHEVSERGWCYRAERRTDESDK